MQIKYQEMRKYRKIFKLKIIIQLKNQYSILTATESTGAINDVPIDNAIVAEKTILNQW